MSDAVRKTREFAGLMFIYSFLIDTDDILKLTHFKSCFFFFLSKMYFILKKRRPCFSSRQICSADR